MSGTTGRRTSIVEIGRIPISLSTDSPAFRELLLQRYSGFLSSSRPEAMLEFDLLENGSVSDDDVRVWRDGTDWRIERGDFRACWNPQTGHGLVKQPPNPYSLDSVLRIVHSLILAGRGGFLLHAASAICEGRAYLFSGVSGAGKTTMTRLAPPDVTLLTDEVSYIQPAAGGYAAFGTPFAGELAKAGENCSAPISGLFFLEKGPDNRVEDISAPDSMRRLLRNILFFAEDPVLVEKLLQTACDFVSRVPVRRLTFYPDARVWDTVRQFQGEALHV
jgi:hypothetical protein